MFKITPPAEAGGNWTLTVGEGDLMEEIECATQHEAVGRLVGHPAYQAVLDDVAAAAANGANGEGTSDANLPERWSGGPNGVVLKDMTGPERDFSQCSFTWRDTPLPLLIKMSDPHGGYGDEPAIWCGTIDTIAGRQDGAVDMGGTFFATEHGELARQILQAQGQVGVSVGPSEYVTGEFECTEIDEEWGMCVAGIYHFLTYEIASLTICPIPGFEDAWIVLDGASDGVAASAAEPLTAATPAEAHALFAPVKAARAWFEMPEPALGSDLLVRQPPRWAGDAEERYATPMTITDDGQVFGHLACAGSCHIGYGQTPDTCVTVPPSPSGYARYHLHAYETAEGDTIAVGPLVANCDHALARERASTARDYYAHSALAWADVRIVEGVHGPWVCGALRHNVTVAQAQLIRAAALSGDWRDHGDGELDLIAAQLVNTPGFPIAREAYMLAASAAVAEGGEAIVPTDAAFSFAEDRGHVTALVAAGIVRRPHEASEALVAAAGCGDCAKRRAGVRRAASMTTDRHGGSSIALTFNVEDQAFKLMMGLLGEMNAKLAAVDLRTRHLAAAEVAVVADRVAALVAGT